MFSDFRKGKELVWRLFLRDFTSRHKQSLLGWLWIILMPLMTMGTFLLLNMSGIIKIGRIDIPYPIFGLVSFSIWNIFSNGLTTTTSSVTGAGGLVQKINFSKDSLVFASFGQVVIDFLIRVALTFGIFLLYGRIPLASFLLFPVVLLPLVLLTLGMGMVTSLLQAISKDVVSFVNLGTGFLLLLMPVMYSAEQVGILGKLNAVNPLYYLVIVPRDIMLYGEIRHLAGFIVSSVFGLIVFVFGWMFFYLSQTKLAERI
ncbi:ABC transporter permease [Candidatus Collierbacteria bacterium]|nr:ABC transporter permease [Candidatus Collierbacteria bacterium]